MLNNANAHGPDTFKKCKPIRFNWHVSLIKYKVITNRMTMNAKNNEIGTKYR